ncbi:amidase [Maribrevibacterium harenarium]|uniref:Amidase n=1 Tax=Maribrevibacterium harenarium TaxID=2589817 RepID=A0A501WUI5_9GAMM|nr:amidase family protein [Maribrevibacterium harenarium]TPE53403.1 amidase [Maribrevibacterium harenarium]
MSTPHHDPIFTERFAEQSPQQGALSGVTVAVKDNLDVAGYHTRAGSLLLGHTPAKQDAEAVARLRAAGAELIGHTNMTELAYSGLGLNPHFGTPANPLFPDRIPGGSTSGGAVAVATGLADAALGTDTGGSLRIPAAFCGLVGFKPTQESVPSQGCVPLSTSLDSIGPMAKDVATCEQLWRVLSGSNQTAGQLNDLEFVVPSNFGLDQLDEAVATGFWQAIETLKQQGVEIQERPLAILEHYKKLPVWQFAAVESARHFAPLFDLNSEQLDPRVRRRIARAASVSPEEFAQTQQDRLAWIHSYTETQANTILLLPTVACLPPRFEQVSRDEDFDRLNLLCLRNTSLANVLDGCSLSLPLISHPGVGLLLTAVGKKDAELLALGAAWETLLTN